MRVIVWRFIGRVVCLFLLLAFSSAAVVSAANIRVEWTRSSADDLAGYWLYYHGTGGEEFPPLDIEPEVVSYTFSGLTVGTTYSFSLYAYDTSDNSSVESNIAVCEALPWDGEADPPVVPVTVWLTEPVFNFSWDVSGFDGAAGAGLEVSRVNESFANPNGTQWDPGHRCFLRFLGVPSGSSTMNAENFQGPGLYQVRVVALDEFGTIICHWSDSAYLEVIAGSPPAVDPDTSTVTADPEEVPADGVSESLITVTPRTAAGDLVGPGLTVELGTTAGTLLGVVQDNGDGTYTQRLRSSSAVTQALVSAIADGVLITQQALVDFTTVPLVPPEWIITGPGPGVDNSPLVRVFDPAAGDMVHGLEFPAYGADSYGVNVCAGDIAGDEQLEIITGPGPGAIYGPHVRGFDFEGAPVDGVNFLAYGTSKWGVNVAAGDLDGDGYDEIVTGAGPGAVFGPHVRGWNVDGGAYSAMPGVSFKAYGTMSWGVNVATGDIDGDGYDEIITGPGPGEGVGFGPHVKVFDYDGGSAVVSIASFLAYGNPNWGVKVACGDIDGDGYDEIVTGAGPGAVFGPHVRGWNVDGSVATSIPGINFLAYGTNKYGVNVTCGDIDGDDIDEIVTGPGPGAMFGAHVRAFDYNGTTIEDIPNVNFMAYDVDVRFGVRIAVGRGVID